MNFEGALAIMRAGGKVRRNSWDGATYLHIANRADTPDTNFFKFIEKVMPTPPGSARPLSAVPYALAHEDIIAAVWVEVT